MLSSTTVRVNLLAARSRPRCVASHAVTRDVASALLALFAAAGSETPATGRLKLVSSRGSNVSSSPVSQEPYLIALIEDGQQVSLAGAPIFLERLIFSLIDHPMEDHPYLVMSQSHPRQHLLRHGQDIPEHIDLEFIKILVDRGLEQCLELMHAILNLSFGVR